MEKLKVIKLVGDLMAHPDKFKEQVTVDEQIYRLNEQQPIIELHLTLRGELAEAVRGFLK